MGVVFPSLSTKEIPSFPFEIGVKACVAKNWNPGGLENQDRRGLGFGSLR